MTLPVLPGNWMDPKTVHTMVAVGNSVEPLDLRKKLSFVASTDLSRNLAAMASLI